MFFVLVASLLCPTYAADLTTPEAEPIVWTVHSETVMQGGPVTIIIEGPPSNSTTLTLRIDDGAPFQLVDGAGPTLHGKGKALILLWHIPGLPEAYEAVEGEPDAFRALPVFHKPGPVRLTLESGDVSLGTRLITVVPLTPRAAAVLDLLYPKVLRNKGVEAADALRMQFLVSDSFGVNPPLTSAELTQIQADVRALKQHPNWAEIVDAFYARLQANLNVQAVGAVLSVEGLGDDGPQEPPSIPVEVSDFLDKTPANPFAKTVQDGIRDTMALRGRIIRAAQLRRAAEE